LRLQTLVHKPEADPMVSPVPSPRSHRSAGQALRRATADAHAKVDGLFSHVDLASAAGYRAFLAAQAFAHLPVEDALDAGGAERVFADWPGRRRAALLRADLEELGGSAEPGPAPRLTDAAELAGAAYVIEGSRLGGALLRRSVGAGLPIRFLCAPAEPGAWRALLLRLDEVLADDGSLARATEAAKRVFGLFADAGRSMKEPMRG
jgi:heme oxygenase (biliverdin-IX-beta and delta-forming)